MALAVLAAGGVAALHPEVVKAFYQDIYPSDPAKRQALDLCFAQDHTFNRLDPGARDACYRHVLAALGELSSEAPAQPAANPVDLHRATGQDRLPLNDIRRLEQTQDIAHAPH